MHRDLKPSNVLVTASAQSPAPKIIDFGIAKAIGLDLPTGAVEFTRADQPLGTLAHMSPEQAIQRRVGRSIPTSVTACAGWPSC